MSNKSEGNRFEQEFALILNSAGFWVHLLQQNKAGQPADIIAAWIGSSTLIDCKDLKSGERFTLVRVEENQKSAMKRFTNRTQQWCWFAVRFPDGEVYMLQSGYVFWLDAIEKKSVTREEMDQEIKLASGFVYKLDDWIHKYY